MENNEGNNIILEYKSKSGGRYAKVMDFKTAYDAADYLIDNNKVSESVFSQITQNAFGFCVRGAKASFPAVDGGRYQLKNVA